MTQSTARGPDANNRSSEQPWKSYHVAAATVIVLFGITVRLLALLGHRAFWCDEAMLAMNITSRGYRGLLGTLDWNQAAPVGYLLAEKFLGNLLGNSEIALRLFSFVSGSGCLILGAILSKRYLGPLAGICAITLLATSETLIYYSNELKQYETDAFLFLAFALLMLHAQRTSWNRRAIIALSAFGAIGLFFSHVFVFAMGGFFLWIILLEGLNSLFKNWPQWLLVAGAWGLAFILDYHFFLGATDSNRFLHAHWSTGFLPHPFYSAAAARWIVRLMFINSAFVIGGDTGRLLAGLLFVCLILGAINQWQTSRPLLLLFWCPVVFVFAAAVAGKFPFEGRLITFLVPGCLISAATALDTLRKVPGAPGRWRCAMAFGLIFLPALSAAGRLTAPDRREELRSILTAIKPRLQPGDTIYVFTGAWPAFEYYRTILSTPDLKIVKGADFGDDFSTYEKNVNRLPHAPRVWLIISHVLSPTDGDQGDLYLAPFARQGRELEHFRAFGAQSALYDMSE